MIITSRLALANLSYFSLSILLHAGCAAQTKAELVAPGIISNNREYCTTLSPDGQTMYFVRQFEDGDAILRTDFVNGTWSNPEPVSFTGTFEDTDPLLSPDGQTMYFMTNRNASQDEEKEDYDIWAVEMADGDWGEPYRLPDFINTSFTEGFPSVTSKGDLYFFRQNKAIRADHDIWLSEKIGGGFDTPHKLRGDINTDDWDGHPFVNAANEYMIFYSYREGGYGRCDLYMSFYNNGAWGRPINLGDLVNKETCEMVPFVTRDGKTLYYSEIDKDGNRNIFKIDFPAIKEACLRNSNK